MAQLITRCEKCRRNSTLQGNSRVGLMRCTCCDNARPMTGDERQSVARPVRQNKPRYEMGGRHG